MVELTERQRAVLVHISRETARRGWAPTLKEIAQHFGWSSLNSVIFHLDSLKLKGMIERPRRAARALRITPAGQRLLAKSWWAQGRAGESPKGAA